jgi:hypothetical protein
MEPCFGQSYLMKIRLGVVLFLSGFILAAQDQDHKIYHSSYVNNEIDTSWKFTITEDKEIGYIKISDQHSYWNQVILSWELPACNAPVVLFQLITPAFRKHEGIIEREDLLNETKLVVQTDTNPAYFYEAKIHSVLKLEDLVGKEFYKKAHDKYDLEEPLLYDLFLITFPEGLPLINKDDSLVEKFSIFFPEESPYQFLMGGFDMTTFKSDGFTEALEQLPKVCDEENIVAAK